MLTGRSLICFQAPAQDTKPIQQSMAPKPVPRQQQQFENDDDDDDDDSGSETDDDDDEDDDDDDDDDHVPVEGLVVQMFSYETVFPN